MVRDTLNKIYIAYVKEPELWIVCFFYLKIMKTLTKGNVIVEEIKIGDIHYEYDLGCGIKSKVITKPLKNSDGNWEWESENVNTSKKINYLVNPKYPHYSINLYDYEAYTVKHYI